MEGRSYSSERKKKKKEIYIYIYVLLYKSIKRRIIEKIKVEVLLQKCRDYALYDFFSVVECTGNVLIVYILNLNIWKI